MDKNPQAVIAYVHPSGDPASTSAVGVWTTLEEVLVWLRRGYDVQIFRCEYPDCAESAARRPSMTCYVNTNGIPTDELNPKPVLCSEHWEEYVSHWNEMWAEYRSSQGI